MRSEHEHICWHAGCAAELIRRTAVNQTLNERIKMVAERAHQTSWEAYRVFDRGGAVDKWVRP